MPVCVVKLCKNYSKKIKKDTGITYHLFPVDPVNLERWAAIIRLSRQESWWKPGKYSVICSAHFDESDFYITKGGLKRLIKGAVPKNALFLSSTPPDDVSKNITVKAEPSTSSVETTPIKTSDTSTKSPPLDDFSDIDSVYDSPRQTKLKKQLHNKTVLHYKHARTIKTLREKVRRLKKNNCFLIKIINSLQQDRFIQQDKSLI